MIVAELLAEARERGVELFSEGDLLRYRAPTGALSEGLHAQLRNHKSEILETLSDEKADLLNSFLTDTTIPAAVFHSRALGCSFLLSRDRPVLGTSKEELPVLYVEESEELLKLGLDGIQALLRFRSEFGPDVVLEGVGTRGEGQMGPCPSVGRPHK